MKSTIKLNNGEALIYETVAGGVKITFQTSKLTLSRVLGCNISSIALFLHQRILDGVHNGYPLTECMVKLSGGENLFYTNGSSGAFIVKITGFAWAFHRVLTLDQARAACFAHEMAMEASDCAAIREQVAIAAHVVKTTAEVD